MWRGMCQSACVILSESVCACLCFGNSKIAPQKADAKITLVGHTGTRPVLDPLAVLCLDNRLFI